MTINEAINWIDEHKPNTLSREDKVRLLHQLDCGIFTEIISTHEGGADSFPGYYPDTDPDTELLAGGAHEQMYLHWLESQIDYYNREYAAFNNTNAVFNADYDAFQKQYNREHMPKGRLINYF